MRLARSSGLLLHITSLPSSYGIGDLGPEAWEFARICAETGQKYWQVLPICPTGFGYSPYASPSSFAGNPLLISPELLLKEGLLIDTDLQHAPDWMQGSVDFEKVIPFKQHLLRCAWQSFQDSDQLDMLSEYAEAQWYWLRDHVNFSVQKSHNAGNPWTDWTSSSDPQLSDWTPASAHCGPQAYYVFEQFLFDKQWSQLRQRCHQHGVSVIGDLPIYVAHDSADVWTFQDQFQLDANGQPIVVAGAPPDFFIRTGQRWGNPLYNWEAMANDGYDWWIRRLRRATELFDVIRLDHFRGFAGYWEIPASEPTAEVGRWVTGPGSDLFTRLEQALGPLPAIAEDLGVITPDVPDLMQQFGFPGMLVLQFGFDSGMDNPHLPHNYPQQLVAYTGTHDNDTLLGWWSTLPDWQKDFATDYLGLGSGRNLCESAIGSVMNSAADLVITPVQDVLALDGQSRMNTPGTVGNNWSWQLTRGQMKDLLENAGPQLKDWTRQSNRVSSFGDRDTRTVGR